MVKNYYPYFLFLIIILQSCSEEQKSGKEKYYYLNIEFKNIDGLENGADVLYKGYKIGKVSELKINTDQTGIIAKISLIDTLKIPVGSGFTIFSADILGKRAINVEFSESKEYLQNDDSVNGKTIKSLGDRIDEEINGIKNRIEILENNDSLLILKLNKEGLDSTILRLLISKPE